MTKKLTPADVSVHCRSRTRCPECGGIMDRGTLLHSDDPKTFARVCRCCWTVTIHRSRASAKAKARAAQLPRLHAVLETLGK